MNLKSKVIFTIIALCQSVSCVKVFNQNTNTNPTGINIHVTDFFNSTGLPLDPVDGNHMDEILKDLTRVSPIFSKVSRNPSDPFFKLSENVDLFVQTQMWKTQLTKYSDVQFYDLATANYSSAKINYKSSDFDFPVMLLNAYDSPTASGNYIGTIKNGLFGKFNSLTDPAKVFVPMSHWYIMEYKLRDKDGSKSSAEVRTYYALVSVPIGLTSSVPLAMYGHGGDFGTSPFEIATIFKEKLANYVVVAPINPGEALCPQIAMQGKGCMRLDQNKNLVKDTTGPYTNPDIKDLFLNSLTPVEYARSPYIEDVNSFLGAHNTISRIMNTERLNLSAVGLNPLYSAALPGHSFLDPLKHTAELLNPFQTDEIGDPYPLIPVRAPKTFLVGASRGGSLALVAAGRMGLLMNTITQAQKGLAIGLPVFNHTVVDADSTTVQFQYSLFNGAALFFSPTSLMTGKLRLLVGMIIDNKLGDAAALPMAADLANNEYFTHYRNAQDYNHEVQEPEKDSHGKIVKITDDPLTQLVTFIASSDITFLAPYLATNLQNWGTFSYSDSTRSPGSMIFLHGNQDQVVPFTDSTIGTQALNLVWAGLYNTTFDPFGNYLDQATDYPVMNDALTGSFIPGTGVAQYAFQPTDQFFNLQCKLSDLLALQQPEVIYNTNMNRCFGHGFSKDASGVDPVGQFMGHFDASFFTGKLINTIDDSLINYAVLSSEVQNENTKLNFTLNDTKTHMLNGPANDGSFSQYFLTLSSPSFMRYMSEEGVPSRDVVTSRSEIFKGNFRPNVTSTLSPHDIFFAWLDNVACDVCTSGFPVKGTTANHFGVFHDYSH